MLFSVEQAFVGRNGIRAPLKRPAWEAKKVQALQFLLNVKLLQWHYILEACLNNETAFHEK